MAVKHDSCSCSCCYHVFPMIIAKFLYLHRRAAPVKESGSFCSCCAGLDVLEERSHGFLFPGLPLRPDAPAPSSSAHWASRRRRLIHEALLDSSSRLLLLPLCPIRAGTRRPYGIRNLCPQAFSCGSRPERVRHAPRCCSPSQHRSSVLRRARSMSALFHVKHPITKHAVIAMSKVSAPPCHRLR